MPVQDQLRDLNDQDAELQSKQNNGLNLERLQSKVKAKLAECEPPLVHIGSTQTASITGTVVPELMLAARPVDGEQLADCFRRVPNTHADASSELAKQIVGHQTQCEEQYYYLKLICNGTLVCRTAPLAMSSRYQTMHVHQW